MTGMEHDEAHPFQDSLLNAVNDLVAYLIVGEVPPPDEYISF
jgi:hypothetical protein